jgi:hypothetical protein
VESRDGETGELFFFKDGYGGISEIEGGTRESLLPDDGCDSSSGAETARAFSI